MPIEICARSICMLRPGVEGLSENDPRAVDRRSLPRAQPDLLVRGRGPASVYLGSADLMPAQPRPAHRGADAGRERPRAIRDRGDARQRLRRHDECVRAAPTAMDAGRAVQRQGADPPGGDDATRSAPGTAGTHLEGVVRARGDDRRMRVGVIDVGSNTARLLVADVAGRRDRAGRDRQSLPRPGRGDRGDGDADHAHDRASGSRVRRVCRARARARLRARG